MFTLEFVCRFSSLFDVSEPGMSSLLLPSFVVRHGRAYQWPKTWRFDQDQATGSYPVHKHHCFMRAHELELHGYFETIWNPISEVLRKAEHECIQRPKFDMKNISEAFKSFYGFLVKVQGQSHRSACKIDNLLNPLLLHAFWEFMVTPKRLLGRNVSRSTMRTMCNSIEHLLSACEALGVESTHHPACTPQACTNWWKEGGQQKACLCPQGQKTQNARGHATIWQEIQYVVKETAEEAVEEGVEVEHAMDICEVDELDHSHNIRVARKIQVGLVLASAGMLMPPLRPACLPTSRQPGFCCQRPKCQGTRAPMRLCTGNQLVVDDKPDPITGDTLYSHVWKHFKNKDRGGYVGSASIRTHTAKMHGPIWQGLQGHWQRWARELLLAACAIPEAEDHGYTYFEPNTGKPWRSVETSSSHPCMSTWARIQLVTLCTNSGKFAEEELGSLDTFGFQEARFSFIQHIERTLFKTCNQETKGDLKKKLCLCMLTSHKQWDKTYATRREHFEDEEEVCMDLRDLGYLQ